MFFKRIIKHSNMGFNIHKLHSITCTQEITNDLYQNLNQPINQNLNQPINQLDDTVSYVTEESTLTIDQIIQALCVFSAIFPSHN